jgi:diketogulonate reductase-like aldo/keto reductase
MNGVIVLNIESKVKLNNGIEMPLFGLGTYQSPDGQIVYDAVRYALKFGYRHIDTAKYYGNEESVGRAIRDSGVPREQIFVTTKLWPTDAINAEKAFETSFNKLNIGYIDLYLIHWPVPGMIKKNWKNMEKLYENGKIKAIGVSNYSIQNLKSTLSVATIKPTVNQVKCSPYNYDQKLHAFCMENGIVMEAYSPLTRGKKLDDPRLIEIGKKYGVTTAQVLLRWCIQKGIPTIPKSVHDRRIAKNADIFDFELSEIDMQRLDNFRE